MGLETGFPTQSGLTPALRTHEETMSERPAFLKPGEAEELCHQASYVKGPGKVYKGQLRLTNQRVGVLCVCV